MTDWWRDAVVYQIYPRSFQDSDGNGIGDLEGIRRRLDHLVDLGVDALWLSPVYPSPMADGGYDVADYEDIDPMFGTLADFDRLVADAHARGLRLLMDVVPCHTSIAHPWFRAHPERYVWSDRDGPANNWRASFGGSAWSRDEVTGRWYLHSFYPEQPDLDWRNPDVGRAIGGVLRFWLERGVDGFRLDAIDRLMKDPQLRDDPPASRPPALPLHPEHAQLEHRHSRDAPDVGSALAQLRAAAPATFLVGEAYVPAEDLDPYLEHLDCCFSFDLLHAPWDDAAVRRALHGASGRRVAWVLSNHDFPRLPDRVGAGNARAAALLALTLPGPVFVYQGDEIGMADGPPADPPDDRYGRDPHRSPMCWDAAAPHGGFGGADPWLPAACPPEGGVAQQAVRADSTLAFHRRLIAVRRELSGDVTPVEAADGVLAFRRGDRHLIAINMTAAPRPAPPAGDVLVHTAGPADAPSGQLGPGEGFVAIVTG